MQGSDAPSGASEPPATMSEPNDKRTAKDTPAVAATTLLFANGLRISLIAVIYSPSHIPAAE